MLLLRDNEDGVWTRHKYRGAAIELKIRACGAEKLEQIRKRHKKIEYAKDPQSRQTVKLESYNEDAIFSDMIDYMLEDFSGIGTAPDKPLDCTPENKKRVLLIPPASGEQPLFDFVLERARELEVIQQQEFESEIKN